MKQRTAWSGREEGRWCVHQNRSVETLNTNHWTQNPEPRTQNPEPRTPNPQPWKP